MKLESLGLSNDIEFETGVLDLSFDLKYYSTIKMFIILMKFHTKYTCMYFVKRIIAIQHLLRDSKSGLLSSQTVMHLKNWKLLY